VKTAPAVPFWRFYAPQWKRESFSTATIQSIFYFTK
jgi:hypothetical protein